MFFYLLTLTASVLMIFLIPKSDYKIKKEKVIPILVIYSAYLLLFINKDFIELKKFIIKPYILIPSFIVFLCILVFSTKRTTTFNDFIKTITTIVLPYGIIYFFPTKVGTFHVIDILVFFLIIYLVITKFLELPLVGGITVFDGYYITMLLITLTVFLWLRNINFGMTLALDPKSIFYTSILTVLSVVSGVLIAIKINYLKFTGFKIKLRDLFNVSVFMFFHIAIGEEIFFRAILINYISQILGLNIIISFAISLVIFGLSHISSGKEMVFLATTIGLFYGLTYILTGSIINAAIVHAITTIVWKLFFKTNEKVG